MNYRKLMIDFSYAILTCAFLSPICGTFLYFFWNWILIKYIPILIPLLWADAAVAMFLFQLIRHFTLSKTDVLIGTISDVYHYMIQTDNNQEDTSKESENTIER